MPRPGHDLPVHGPQHTRCATSVLSIEVAGTLRVAVSEQYRGLNILAVDSTARYRQHTLPSVHSTQRYVSRDHKRQLKRASSGARAATEAGFKGDKSNGSCLSDAIQGVDFGGGNWIRLPSGLTSSRKVSKGTQVDRGNGTEALAYRR